MITGTSIFLGQFLSSRLWISFLDHPLPLRVSSLSLSRLHPSPPPTIMPTSSRPQEPQATPQPSALCLLLTICSNTTQRVVCGPATSASFRNLLEMQILALLPSPITCNQLSSQKLWGWAQHSVFSQAPRKLLMHTTVLRTTLFWVTHTDGW